MRTTDNLKEEINLLNLPQAEKLFKKNSFNDLPEILNEFEKIKFFTEVYYDTGTGTLILTNERILFVRRSWLGGLTAHHIYFENINSISFKKGLSFGELHFNVGGENYKMQIVDKKEGPLFEQYTWNEIRNRKLNIAASANKESDEDIINKIEKLAALRDKGILTEDEFQEKKQDLLDQI
jgi:hypothetical protein